MHPILFRIPLPRWPLRLWWALALFALLAAVYAGLARRRGDRTGSLAGVVVTLVLVAFAYLFRATVFEAGNLPIFSYGVMLGLSLIGGWFLTLRLADRAGIPKDVVANCFLVAGVVAVLGARLLYVVSNLGKFDSLADVTNLRAGGYDLYGGFLGGLLGSWLYLRQKEVSVLRWGDLTAPSLALGLFLTRIGCYLFGCDFGSRLAAGAPVWLQKLGTFPHWTGATQDAGEGSGPYLKQLASLRGTPEGMELGHRDVSFPVHPTQIYESLAGLALLGLAWFLRRRRPEVGRPFTGVVFGYGVIRFVVELVRDDPDHHTFGLELPFHVMLALGLALFAAGYAAFMARAISDERVRLATRIAAFLPAALAFFVFRPAAFAPAVDVKPSMAQYLALLTGLAAAYVFGDPPRGAEGTPLLVQTKSTPPPDDEVEDDDSLPAPA